MIYFARFKARNAFIGYQKDTPATVVFQASNQLQRQKMRQGQRKWEGLEQVSILGDIPVDELTEEVEGSTLWKQAVSYQKYCENNKMVWLDMVLF